VNDAVELTIVMPCLNEEETLAHCIEKAHVGIQRSGVRGEILVADNGSKDDSVLIAERLGVRVVHVKERGYGNALRGGIQAASGKWIVMGDADESYDFSETDRFLKKFQEGFELVIGCRLPKGGGRVLPGAMPFSHRWLGNPLFSQMARHMFSAPIHDVNCGLRGFTRELYDRLQLQCEGMEFAPEMIIKASLHGARIVEIPISLHPDGRRTNAPHLRTVRDGWRTLRFFLIFSPRWLFLVPGFIFAVLGLAGYAVALPRMQIVGVTFDVHTLLFSSLAILMGYQSVLFAIFAKAFAISAGLLPKDPRVDRFFNVIYLERGLAIGGAALLSGLILLGAAVLQWKSVRFGRLDYAVTMRWVIPGATLTAFGFQTVLSSFLLSILGMKHRPSVRNQQT
jgi:glycosyltransferase involved in cell wall biosynthesis